MVKNDELINLTDKHMFQEKSLLLKEALQCQSFHTDIKFGMISLQMSKVSSK